MRRLLKTGFLRNGLAAAAALGGLWFAFSLKAGGEPVAIVVTEKAAAYETVAEEIESRLKGQTKLYNMKDSRKNDDKIVAQIATQQPSLIIALGDKAALLASEKLTTYPVLIGMVLELDLEAFKKPGIEAVGLQIPAQSVLTQLKLLVPEIRQVGILSSGLKFASFRQSIRTYAAGLGLQVTDIVAPNGEELEKKLDQELPNLDAVWLLPDPNIIDAQTFEDMVEKAKKAKKALVVFSENFVKAGAFFSVSPDYRATAQQLALLAGKMMAKESVRPEKPYLERFHYPIGTYSVVNKKTAAAIGIELSPMQLGFINRVVNGESKD